MYFDLPPLHPSKLQNEIHYKKGQKSILNNDMRSNILGNNVILLNISIYLFKLYKKTKTATGMVNNSPNSKRTMIAILMAIARITIGKNSKDSSSLLNFNDARACLGETSPEHEQFVDLENHERNPWCETCL